MMKSKEIKPTWEKWVKRRAMLASRIQTQSSFCPEKGKRMLKESIWTQRWCTKVWHSQFQILDQTEILRVRSSLQSSQGRHRTKRYSPLQTISKCVSCQMKRQQLWDIEPTKLNKCQSQMKNRTFSSLRIFAQRSMTMPFKKKTKATWTTNSKRSNKSSKTRMMRNLISVGLKWTSLRREPERFSWMSKKWSMRESQCLLMEHIRTLNMLLRIQLLFTRS